MQKLDFEQDGHKYTSGMSGRTKIGLIAAVAVAVILVAIITPVAYFLTRPDDSASPLPTYPTQKPDHTAAERLNCYPEDESNLESVTREKCELRNCVYKPDPGEGGPLCYFPVGGHGYAVTGAEDTDLGFKVALSQRGKFPFGAAVQELVFQVEIRSDHLLRFKFDDPNRSRYKVPVVLNLPRKKAKNPKYKVEIFNQTGTDLFAFRIIRIQTGTVIWDTGIGGLTFTDQFLQIATRLPSSNIYGFGENRHKSFRHDLKKTWPMFSRDQGPGFVDEANLYGVHPFYTCIEDPKGNSHGVLLLNSNAQEYSFTTAPSLTYRTIGGILDFYVFMGPTPEAVIQQYTEVIGRPYMPPYWALGFQLCRFGYNNTDDLKAAVNRTKKYAIPHDVQYADIDYMDKWKDFTVDNVSFAGLNDYFQSLRDGGMRTIIILDPALITNVSGYEPYNQMKTVHGNIQWPENSSSIPSDSKDDDNSLLGYVWPNGKVVFPDFFKNSTRQVWQDLIVKQHSTLVFDGLWIDMNEPANFGTNEERPWNWPESAKPYWSLKCPTSTLDDPPYRTKASYLYDGKMKARLSEKTICMIARQGDTGEYSHYDVHSLYGWSQTKPTLIGARKATGERSVIISRSTFTGSGQYAGHWLGDNISKWSHLAESIIGMLEFNLFGIPYIGADICGFMDNTTEEMCHRWMQLGAFYPFSRNHNGIKNMPQDPGALGDFVGNSSREMMETRYWLLPYLYTLFHYAHTQGDTVVRPLHHEFSTDGRTYSIDRQFLWGSALMVSPILEMGQTKLSYYLPVGRWYNLFTKAAEHGPSHKEIAVTLDSKPLVQVRGGHILPMQAPANNTHYSRRNPFKLLVALDMEDVSGGKAQGSLFWDDGVSIDTFENGNYYITRYSASKQSLHVTVERNSVSEIKDLYYDTIEILGVLSDVTKVFLQKTASGDWVYNFTYNKAEQILLIHDANFPLQSSFSLHWGHFDESDFSRIDCYPEIQGRQERVTKENCKQRGCTYKPADHSAIPACFTSEENQGYSINGTVENTTLGLRVPLVRRGSGMYQQNIEHVTFEVEFRGDDMIHFKFYDPNIRRYEVPIELNLELQKGNNSQMRLNITNNETFSFQIIRTSTDVVLWDTSVGGLNFADQFLQIATRLPSQYVYGLGENLHKSLRHNLWYQTWPAFSRDQPVVDAWGDNNNHYGVHPFYMCMEEDGKAHGVLLLNSNAQDFSFSPLPMLTYRTTGGILDFYMFLGSSPELVVQQYTKMIGLPYMPPYWGLGFQQCRYGYNSLDKLKAAVNRTRSADIPLDVQYADIDHMDERKDFTIDMVNFKGLPDYFRELRNLGMKTIILLDPTLISNETNYEPYEKMKAVGANIKWPENVTKPEGSFDSDRAILGYVWPKGKVVFPDFFKNKTIEVWKSLINESIHRLPVDGLWIDMNEPANFGTNEEKPFNWPEKDKPYWSLKCPYNQYDDPPYRTKAAYNYDNSDRKGRLSDKTLCMVSRQGQHDEYKHYDVHSLYGWSQTRPTLDALRDATGNRGLVISRSTFPGSGKYTGHWLGDNRSTWRDMKLSIIGILEFNLFGIPYIGADICGFFDDTNPELCKRWMQLGAFYTFSRNHNGINYIDQDPGLFGGVVTSLARDAIRTRYWLLPYLYTLFHYAHVEGQTVIRPLHHEFSKDKMTYSIDEQFLWGPALLISPILQEKQRILHLYLPKGRWYNYYTGKIVTQTGQEMITQSVNDDSPIPLHIRGGHIIPMQEPANTTFFSRQNPFRLVVALENETTHEYQASGSLFWDDGVSTDTYQVGNYYFSLFECKQNTLNMTVKHDNVTGMGSLHMETVEIWGLKGPINNVTVNGAPNNFNNSHPEVLLLKNLSLSLNTNFSISWM
ncbi:maltase-glucoamylase, intestinal-like [Gigantopelta aegis]|uniref:maltase-glucoamylase, intestinal-like n=1 Tax=Gigantopelta aegis TaxID=1735272 RepID=UPI001B8881A9|nr:maltase-glucoamylase, intestinal-like [Gigantopelta aegis]